MLQQNIFHLFDKYLKSGDNFLPLKAFLQYIEKHTNDIDGFQAISSEKSTNTTPVQTDPNKSTLKLLKKPNDEVVLIQILYKIIITIDYSPQLSSLDFIQKGLETIFNKLNNEFDEFYSSCSNTEPQIYVTVLLWNTSSSPSSLSQIPFIILLHSKRLLKSNLNDISMVIFNKINETKSIILESVKSNKTELRVNTGLETDLFHKPKTKSHFEEFIRMLIKIFNFFEITSHAATSLACAHHIHLTEGVIYANDMIRCLEKISKSSISFSFIYTGANGNNISSSFGHLADCSLMKQIANMTNGFFYYLDQSLEKFADRNFFYFFTLKNIDLSESRDEPRTHEVKLEYEPLKDLGLMQWIRIRVQEGFYLTRITRKKDDQVIISLYFKKYFSQTITLTYKVFYVLDPNPIYHIEFKLSSDSLILKAKHSNHELSKRFRTFRTQMEKSTSNPQFLINSSMLDPPEILAKYKEPLYKLYNGSITDDNLELQNLKFELNNRTIKKNEVDYYDEYRRAWNIISLFKLQNKVLNRYFAIHTLKLVLHHDRPLPDINTCIFDTKTRIILEPQNPNFIPNNIFQCTKSINELRVMLTSWCDIMLAENCVFLKFLESSAQYLKPKPKESKTTDPKEDEVKDDKLSETNNSTNNSIHEITKNSFVICIINEQYAPYVSLQFWFHSTIFYLDRVRLLNSFKEKLTEVNFKKQVDSETPIYLEQIHLLPKPDLFDAFQFILFDEIQNSPDPKLNQSSKLVNFMNKKKFKWVINKNFSVQTAQSLKETLIDTFIRMRLKEGFKCLFQCSKFVAFTLQLAMFDSADSQSNKTFKNGSSQLCVFIYVIRFMNSKKSTLLNIAGSNEVHEEIDNDVYFTTELYVEAIDGVYQDRTRKKDKDYFKNLSNLEILNLIYLQDLKCFSILQSSYALFLSKNNLIQNLQILLSKTEILNVQQLIGNLELKDALTSILNFEPLYYECIRLMPDIGLVLNKHSIKDSKNKSRLSNTTSQYLFNRVNYNNRSFNKRESFNPNMTSQSPDNEVVNVKKKSLNLREQLRPVLNSIDISRFYLNQVEFDFSLKGILFESSLYVSVYDDIPFNLFNNLSKSYSDCSRKIQNYFLQNVDDTFSKMDDTKENNQTYNSVINNIKSDIKNALMLKISDIKTGDSITKKILEHLRQSDDSDSFKSFIKFNVSQVTSKHSITSPSAGILNPNKIDSNPKTMPWASFNNTAQTQLITQQYDVENNKFYVYGLFFIPSEPSNTDSPCSVQQDPNRLVFFIFNTVTESVKNSLIHTQSNTYLTRKSLFTLINSNEHRFYFSKNSISKASSNQDLKTQQIQLNPKKLSDILKQNLGLTQQNDSIFLNLIDSIEESCAKSYIKSLIHYLSVDLNDNVHLEKQAMHRLLRLGHKINLTDIDLSDYFKIVCKHMSNFVTFDTCPNQLSGYLDQKFDQIFLKRFQTIPGFDDLFIFQTDTAKEIEEHPHVEYFKYDDELSMDGEVSEESANDSESLDDENLYESDTGDLKHIIKKKVKKILKSSSPYSNLGKHLSSNETSFVSKENLIGIELVCQLSCEYGSDTLTEPRTRTTTLTPENNDPEESVSNPTIQNSNKLTFYSKFSKFNFNCVLNLIENKDLENFKNFINKLGFVSEDGNEVPDDIKGSIKIFLRFNWYSFNEINLNYPLNLFAPTSQGQGSSNLSTHSSTTTMFNPNPQFLGQNVHKFENFNLLEPSLNEFRWYLKDEILKNETEIKNFKVFFFYIGHIKYGCEAGYLNCSKLKRKVVLNKVTTRTKQVIDAPNNGRSLLHQRASKIQQIKQYDEDRSIISVDSQKFYKEFTSLIKQTKFCDCSIQGLSDNFYFLDCLYKDKSVRFKIFLTIKKECIKSNSTKNSPVQDGSSSPNVRMIPDFEVIINQTKIRTYFNFNYNDLDVHVDRKKIVDDLVTDFDFEIDKIIRLSYLKLTLKDIDDTRKWNNSLVLQETPERQSSFTDQLVCNCVWSVLFKLHRLHQNSQKDHETNTFVSHGLSKLRECLHNFSIESSIRDLYVYTRIKEVFVLKLDEVYDDDDKKSGILSRRPSCASMNDTDQTIISSRNPSSHGLKTQHSSGGNPQPVQTPQTQSKQNPPEYIKLSVYGVNEPDDEMKKDLCKTLQSELDYWLLNRMSNSLDKNTYKTSSQYHYEKITDEDMIFFKQVSDNTFDYELNLPFVFNFNRTLRENFIFYLKQVLNMNFKAIEAGSLKTSETHEQKYLTSQLSFSYIPESKSFTKKNSDPLQTDMISISRIFFQNTKSKRIGKQNISLILVEVLYSIKGLDLVSNKVTRSNSMGASSIKFQPEASMSEKKHRQIGPTCVFRFYCRGENPEITNYKLALKTALNDALIFFLTDYVTKIDPGDFVKKVHLKKRPAKFRVCDSETNMVKIHRKRHKSTGATELNSHKQFLKMNKTAKDSKLGRLLTSQKISDSVQLNNFVLNNFSFNLFDHKDYEDTLQYFKEPIRVLNLINEIESDESGESSDSDEDEIALYKVQRSISMEPDLSKLSLDKISNEKTYLKLIYDWLKGINSLNTTKITSPNPQQGSFILRRQFSYRTKYNLTNMIKDLETCVKEMYKSDLSVNYFSFKKEGGDSGRDCVFFDDDDLEMEDFTGLKTSKLASLSQNLIKGENILVTMNSDNGCSNSGVSSMSSSMNSSTLTTYARVPSFGNGSSSSSTLIQSSSSSGTTVVNPMIKSISSTNGDLDSSLSLSSSQTMFSLNVKRTFCYVIVNVKLKNVTVYCFNTDASSYDPLKQWLDQTSDWITQRYHLVNNTVLYKLGGMIGDHLIHDLKKVKQLAVSASCGTSDVSSVSQTDLLTNDTKVQLQKQSSIKFSKSPTINRQMSYNKPSTSNFNPALITNLTFTSSTSSTPTQTATASTTQTHQQSTFSIKQLNMSPFNIKSYDSIVNIVNQQVNFCVQYLTPQTSSNPSDYGSVMSPNNVKTINQNPRSNSIYGVGLCYQLYETQQVYRHPGKIYELAIGLGSQQNISPNSNTKTVNPLKPVSSSTSLISPVNQTNFKFNLGEFFKNYIQPVMIPFHYCCTPLLFYSNWNESITNEKMLKKNSTYKLNKSNNSNSINESWYFNMRQVVLIEYSKYFESREFTRLKDDRQLQQETNKTKNPSQNESQILHFIKWIQQDGFLYLTINLEEIYLHAKLGYCTRYRSSNRQSFINEIIRFLTQDFHVHSFIYDFHLSAINSNFLSTSQSGMQISQTSYIISKFLDEFVEFFSRVPLYSQNKVFKLVYEKPDNSLKPNQYTLIFDFISYANKRLNKKKTPLQTLHTFGNNLTIYSLNDSENSSKYLIVKIEQFYKDVLKLKLSSQNIGKLTDKPRQELYIRITCFYLFINKTPQSGLFANHNVQIGLNNDLDFINRVIEESISMHRQEIFWDNLALSMNTIQNTINETSTAPLFGFEMNNQELEQILSISQQINILDLDPELKDFMSHCYEIRDKIKNHLTFSLGRNYIYTESESIEYCLLIINETLIKNFRFKEAETSTTMSEEQLKYFVLIKFDKVNQRADLYQVNRVKINETSIQMTGSKDLNQVVNLLLKSKSYKSLGFTINILMYILWENLFFTS